jgi:hypothetical protein
MTADFFHTQKNNHVREAGAVVIKDGQVHMPQGVDFKYWGGGPATFNNVSENAVG